MSCRKQTVYLYIGARGIKYHRSVRQALCDATRISLGQRRRMANEGSARQTLTLIRMRRAYRLV